MAEWNPLWTKPLSHGEIVLPPAEDDLAWLTGDPTEDSDSGSSYRNSRAVLPKLKCFLAGFGGTRDLRPTKRVKDVIREPATELETFTRHCLWSERRERMRAALARAGAEEARMLRFDECGSHAVVERKAGTEDVRIVGFVCRDRFCEPCGRGVAWLITQNVEHAFGEPTWRLLTLTVKHRPVSLADQVKRLDDCFRRFRRTDAWKAHVNLGIVFLETKLADDGVGWHPHYHAMLDGTYWPVDDLRERWLKCTGDSNHVKINLVRGSTRVFRYVAKYVTKGVSNAILEDPTAFAELFRAWHHRRVCRLAGDCPGLRLRSRAVADGEWKSVGRLDDLVGSARAGEPGSVALLRRAIPASRCAAVVAGTAGQIVLAKMTENVI